MLSADKKRELMSLDLNDIALLKDILSNKYDVKTKKIIPPKFPPTEKMTLEKDEYFNKEKIVTTVGRYVVNKAVYRDTILSHIGYINEVIGDKMYKTIDGKISELLIADKITTRDFKDYIRRMENFTFALINSTTNSFSEKSLSSSPVVLAKKEELFKKYAKEIAEKDIDTVVKIEKELVELARKEMAGDPGMDSYNSGSRGSFESNYKELNIMKGPVFNPMTGEWDIVKNGHDEGFSKEDMHVHGNSITTGGYPKAIGTAVSGHQSKQLIASLETEVLDDDPNSFCGTKKRLPITIDPSISSEFIGRTIMDGSKEVVLTPDNISKYVGKKVEMYSPKYCLRVKGSKICGKCGDKRAISLGYYNLGIASSKISATMLNAKMKQFHNATVAITKLDKDKLFY